MRSLVITLSCAVEEITSFSFSTVIAILSPATILSTSVPALISVGVVLTLPTTSVLDSNFIPLDKVPCNIYLSPFNNALSILA